MSKALIRQIVRASVNDNGMIETGIKGVRLFRITEPVQCAPAVYEPSVVVILSGCKEAIFDGKKLEFGSEKYLCCTMPMPLESGTPDASPDNPFMGIYISLDASVMAELAIAMERAPGAPRNQTGGVHPQGLVLSRWDETFSQSLLNLLQLRDNPADITIMADSRLRELYYAILKGDAGAATRRAFGVGNEISRSIEYLSSNLEQSVTIDDLAGQVGMSRAVFHRKFKQATSMSPIQFVKSMRLNRAATMIAGGMSVNLAAMDVGYVSSSQFSREFKRVYGLSPKQWNQYNHASQAVI